MKPSLSFINPWGTKTSVPVSVRETMFWEGTEGGVKGDHSRKYWVTRTSCLSFKISSWITVEVWVAV